MTKAELLDKKATLVEEQKNALRAEEIDEKGMHERSLQIERINGQLDVLDDEPEVRSEMGPQVVTEKTEDQKKDEYRSAFFSYLTNARANEPQLRAMNTGTDTAGGYLVPTELEKKMVDVKSDKVTMRQLGSVMTTTSEKDIPIQGSIVGAEYIAEGAAYPEDDATVGSKNFKPIKFGKISKATVELLDDAPFNVEQYITDLYKRASADGEEALFISGTGTNEAEGVLVGGTSLVTAAATATITPAEWNQLRGDHPAKYDAGAKFLASKEAVFDLMSQCRADNSTWRFEIVGEKYFFEGVEIAVSDAMPGLAAGNKAIAYGDFSYYQILDRQQMKIEILDQLYKANGIVGIQFTERSDAKLLVAEAVSYLTMAAS